MPSLKVRTHPPLTTHEVPDRGSEAVVSLFAVRMVDGQSLRLRHQLHLRQSSFQTLGWNQKDSLGNGRETRPLEIMSVKNTPQDLHLKAIC